MSPQNSSNINDLVRQAHDSEVQFGTYHGHDTYSIRSKLELLGRVEELLKKGYQIIEDDYDLEPDDDYDNEGYEKVLAGIVYVVFDIAGAHDYDFDAAIKAEILRKFRRPPTAPAGPPPPLKCDCYAGCWADHSEGWPEVHSGWRAYCVENFGHGTFVVMKDCIRVNHSSLVDHVNQAYGDMMRPQKLEGKEHTEAVERLTNDKPVTKTGGPGGEAS